MLLESPAAGLVVDVGDVQQLARTIESVLDDAAMRTRLGENARLRFESRFSLETLSKEVISLYEKLLNRNVMGRKV
jgi:glycosyltransferase involved in cell wall biosynthesis